MNTLRDIVGLALIESKEHGYVSRNKSAELNVPSTAEKVVIASNEPMPITDHNQWITDSIRSEVTKVIEFVKKYPITSDTSDNLVEYFMRIKSAYNTPESTTVTKKEIPLIVSALGFYNNQKMTSDDYQNLIKNSVYIGEVKKRDNFFVKLIKSSYIQKDNYWIYKFITREGNLGYFFRGTELPIQLGDCFMFKGTPIEHNLDRFDSVPVTKFNRISFMENYGNASNTTDIPD